MNQLVVALGNPGNEYENTRHNIAWTFLDKLDLSKEIIWKKKFKGLVSEKNIDGEKIIFLKPLTYMNLSGESVIECLQFYKITPDKMLVIQDEIDLPMGQIHFKMGGGLAGHNGLKSIVQHIGTENFPRLRIGVGRPVHGSVSGWVLSSISTEDKKNFSFVFKNLEKLIIEYFKNGLNQKINNWNKKNLIEESV